MQQQCNFVWRQGEDAAIDCDCKVQGILSPRLCETIDVSLPRRLANSYVIPQFEAMLKCYHLNLYWLRMVIIQITVYFLYANSRNILNTSSHIVLYLRAHKTKDYAGYLIIKSKIMIFCAHMFDKISRAIVVVGVLTIFSSLHCFIIGRLLCQPTY